jgi:hypothetical protein
MPQRVREAGYQSLQLELQKCPTALTYSQTHGYSKLFKTKHLNYLKLNTT